MNKVKEAIHDKALDEAASKASSLEHMFSRKWWFHHESERINDFLREKGIKYDDGSPVRVGIIDHDEQFKISGKNWSLARDFWRNEMRAMFPAPQEEQNDAQ